MREGSRAQPNDAKFAEAACWKNLENENAHFDKETLSYAQEVSTTFALSTVKSRAL